MFSVPFLIPYFIVCRKKIFFLVFFFGLFYFFLASLFLDMPLQEWTGDSHEPSGVWASSILLCPSLSFWKRTTSANLESNRKRPPFLFPSHLIAMELQKVKSRHLHSSLSSTWWFIRANSVRKLVKGTRTREFSKETSQENSYERIQWGNQSREFVLANSVRKKSW